MREPLRRTRQGDPPCYGVLAEFSGPGALARACRTVRDAGYVRWDAHTPYPVHGLPKAMGLRQSVVPWFTLIAGLGAAAAGFALQVWTHGTAYPVILSGKPFFSWPEYVPVTFELGVLGAVVAAVLSMLGLNRLPMLHHPLFDSERFEGSSDDKFFLSIESKDPEFDRRETVELLTRNGAVHVELVAPAPRAAAGGDRQA